MGDAALYRMEPLPDDSTMAFEDAKILCTGMELEKLSIPFAHGLG